MRTRLLGPVSAAALIFAGVVSVTAQTEKDQRRPPCTSAACTKIKSYLKAHYCGESPFGNGPPDGCAILLPKEPRTGLDVTADFTCEWSESKRGSQCQQHGQPSPLVRGILARELRRLGLPPGEERHTFFTVWKASSAGWSLAVGTYSRQVGNDLSLCQAIVLINQDSQALVLRKVPFQKTSAEVPMVTRWSPVDLADVDGDGRVDIILEGDSYENHWLEVDSVRDSSSKTIFTGLGYYL
jgi:hypothetical protein